MSFGTSSRYLSYSSSTFDIELDIEKDRVSVSKANREIIDDKQKAIKCERNDGLNNEPLVTPSCFSNWDALRDGSEEKRAYDSLNTAFCSLYKRLLTQLLDDQHISLSWLNIIQQISTKVSSAVRPNTRNDVEEMDVRNYVKIKKIANGSKSDCQMINGIVFTKNVAHRKMRQNFIQPKILLLSSPIQYQWSDKRLTNLDLVLAQEYEYIRNVIAKICSYGPDIVLVEKTVTRIAQEMLLEKGIILVYNVKPIVLERISRFTGASIVSSLDSHIGSPQLGSCQKFYVNTFNQKTLMYFDGCPQHLGCSLIMRGASNEELKQIKSICAFMIFCEFNWQLERSFLMDEYCLPSLEIHNQYNESNKDLANFPDNSSLKEDSDRKNRNFDSIIINDNSDPLRSMAINTHSKEITSPGEELNHEILEKKQDSDINDAMKCLLTKYQLSCSPFITIPLPYLMTNEGKNSKLRKFFDSNLVRSKRFEHINSNSSNSELLKVVDSINSRQELSSPTEIISVQKHPLLTRELKYTANSNEIKSLLADFRAKGPFILPKKKVNKEIAPIKCIEHCKRDNKTDVIDVLIPKHHQRFPVLFSSFSYASANAPNYCVKPWIVNMDFYGCQDIPLGGFLERYCFRTSYACPSTTCLAPMIEHVRRFVHGNGCILIMLRQLNQLQQNIAAAQSNIITWSWCQKCKTGTPYSNLSADSWCLSFAKYLELKFYGSTYRRRATSSSVACLEHSLHQDHFQFFAHKQIVAIFKYEPIILQEISLPSSKTIIDCDPLFRQTFIESLNLIAVKGYEVYSLILEKLCFIKDETSNTKYEIIINEFLAIETRERAFFRQKIEEIQLELVSQNVNPVNFNKIYKLEDCLVNLKKLIAESVFNWNLKIQDFAINKKKEEKLSLKSTTQSNLNQNKVQNAGNGNIENTSEQNESTILENTLQKSISLSSTTSLLTSAEVSNHSIDASEMLKETQETLDVLKFDDSFEHKELNAETIAIQDNCLTVSSYGYDVDKGINSCFGNATDCEFDVDNYAVYHFADVSEAKKPEDTQSTQSTNSLTATVNNDVTKSTVTFQSVATDSTPSAVKRIFREFLNTSNNLTIDSPFPLSEHYLLPAYKDKPAFIVKDEDPGSIIAFALTSFEYEKQLSDLSRMMSSPNVKRKPPLYDDNDNIGESLSAKPSTNATTQHIELHFNDYTTKFNCCVYFAELFRKFRAIIMDDDCAEELYVRSLIKTIPWKARGGKSGSTFCKTTNDRFILKEMSRLELESFLNIANYYFDYYNRAIAESKPTLLAKIVGVYKTSFKNSSTNNESKLYLLVMENLFYGRNITQKFDLKGSMRNRLVDINSPNLKNDQIVLLDENLLKMTCDSPLYIALHSKTILRSAIDNDSNFLSSHSVMDYSLLVGIDDQRCEFVIGIIDYIRPFTWDKKIESVVKSVGSQGKLPTIVSPNLYRIRFCDAMDQYFLCVPDKWFYLVNYR